MRMRTKLFSTKLFSSKNLVLFGFAFIMSMFVYGCGEDKKPNDTNILVGQFTWSVWQQQAGWSDYSASDYNPATVTTDSITKLMQNKDVSFILFGSSWCPDCMDEMPKFMKLCTLIGFEQDEVIIYGLDRSKAEPTGTHLRYNIQRVPTLIILVDNEEIGRIVEFPTQGLGWEGDLLNFLSR